MSPLYQAVILALIVPQFAAATSQRACVQSGRPASQRLAPSPHPDDFVGVGGVKDKQSRKANSDIALAREKLKEATVKEQRMLDDAVARIERLKAVEDLLLAEFVGWEAFISKLMATTRRLEENFRKSTEDPDFNLKKPAVFWLMGPSGVAKTTIVQRWVQLMGLESVKSYHKIKPGEPMLPAKDLVKSGLSDGKRPEKIATSVQIYDEVQNLFSRKDMDRYNHLNERMKYREHEDASLRPTESEVKEWHDLREDLKKIAQRVEDFWPILANGKSSGKSKVSKDNLENIEKLIESKEREDRVQSIEGAKNEIAKLRELEAELQARYEREKNELNDEAKNQIQPVQRELQRTQEQIHHYQIILKEASANLKAWDRHTSEHLSTFLSEAHDAYTSALLKHLGPLAPEAFNLKRFDGDYGSVEINRDVIRQVSQEWNRAPNEVLDILWNVHDKYPTETLDYRRSVIFLLGNPKEPIDAMKSRIGKSKDPDVIYNAALAVAKDIPDYIRNLFTTFVPSENILAWMSRFNGNQAGIVPPLNSKQFREVIRRQLINLSAGYQRNLKERGIIGFSLLFQRRIVEMFYEKGLNFQDPRNIFDEPSNALTNLIEMVAAEVTLAKKQGNTRALKNLQNVQVVYDPSSEVFSVIALTARGVPLARQPKELANIQMVSPYKGQRIQEHNESRPTVQIERDSQHMAARAVIGMVMFGSIPKALSRIVDQDSSFVKKNWPEADMPQVSHIRRSAAVLVAGHIVETMGAQGTIYKSGETTSPGVADALKAKEMLLSLRTSLTESVATKKSIGVPEPSLKDIVGKDLATDPVLKKLFDSKLRDAEAIEQAMILLNREVEYLLHENIKLVEALTWKLAQKEGAEVVAPMAAGWIKEWVRREMVTVGVAERVLNNKPGDTNVKHSRIVVMPEAYMPDPHMLAHNLKPSRAGKAFSQSKNWFRGLMKSIFARFKRQNKNGE